MLVGNIGVGLFALIIVWILALIIFVLGIKLQNNIAWISLSVAASLTIVLIVIPHNKPGESTQVNIDVDEDNSFIYHIALLFLLLLSSVLGVIFFFVLHIIEPIRPRAIKIFENHEF